MPDKDNTFPLNNDPKSKNEFINADETVNDSPTFKSEADKADETSNEDFDSFNLDKVDELQKSKDDTVHDKD